MTTFETYLEHKMRNPNFAREYNKEKRAPQTATQIKQEATRYLHAKSYLEELRKARKWIGDEKYAELREMALSGDLNGAISGLGILMNSRNVGV